MDVREINDRIRAKLEGLAVVDELQDGAVGLQHWQSKFGLVLGSAAHRYASLERMDSEAEAAERQRLASAAAAALGLTGERDSLNPILAAIDAAEARATAVYSHPRRLGLRFRPVPEYSLFVNETTNEDATPDTSP